ncbi:CH-like domain in sperm protein, partial [Phytophthora infestans]
MYMYPLRRHSTEPPSDSEDQRCSRVHHVLCRKLLAINARSHGRSIQGVRPPVGCILTATMAELLLRWLNHELELSSRVTDVESDFSSGYLLGEILHRLNHQPNFADFMRSSSADAKVVNFCLLEPTLHKLNVKFDANVAVAIMNEKKD